MNTKKLLLIAMLGSASAGAVFAGEAPAPRPVAPGAGAAGAVAPVAGAAGAVAPVAQAAGAEAAGAEAAGAGAKKSDRKWFVKARHGGLSKLSQGLAHGAWSAALVTSIVSQLFRANARLKAAAKLKKAEHTAGTRFISQEDAETLDREIKKFFNMKAFGEMLTGHLKGTVLRGTIYDIVNAWLTNLLVVERGIAVGEHLAGAEHLQHKQDQAAQ